MASAPEYCPNCDAAIPRKAKACPSCGADENTGWSEAATDDPLGLDTGEFNYDEFAEREFGAPKKTRQVRPAGMKIGWWLAGVVLLVLFVLGALSSFLR